jgi:hypothetical protein
MLGMMDCNYFALVLAAEQKECKMAVTHAPELL